MYKSTYFTSYIILQGIENHQLELFCWLNPIEVYTTTRHVISDSLVKRLDLSVNASDPTDGKVFFWTRRTSSGCWNYQRVKAAICEVIVNNLIASIRHIKCIFFHSGSQVQWSGGQACQIRSMVRKDKNTSQPFCAKSGPINSPWKSCCIFTQHAKNSDSICTSSKLALLTAWYVASASAPQNAGGYSFNWAV